MPKQRTAKPQINKSGNQSVTKPKPNAKPTHKLTRYKQPSNSKAPTQPDKRKTKTNQQINKVTNPQNNKTA